MAHLIDAALEPVQRLVAALNHAKLVANAHDEAEKADAIEAGEILDTAYRDSRHSSLGFATLCDIARYGNIQPAILWRVDNEAQVEILELMRVLGRVEAGAEVLMSPNVMSFVFEGLNGLFVQPSEDNPLGPMVRECANELVQLLGRDNLDRMLAKVEDTGKSLLVERRSRKMKIVRKQKAIKVIFRLKKWLKWPF